MERVSVIHLRVSTAHYTAGKDCSTGERQTESQYTVSAAWVILIFATSGVTSKPALLER
jgi:hypothetical protein